MKGWGCCGWGMGFGWWMGWPMLIFSILTAAIIIAGIWAIFKALRPSSSNRSYEALEILKNRYARGEITAEEYNRIRKEILES
ncbi:SHOCT domain-containing protein [Candidatus Bathyarchaeota archaeon]|nr:SHOCT domain-containing protein [Candidatus Bathyarchaeota archaeon]